MKIRSKTIKKCFFWTIIIVNSIMLFNLFFIGINGYFATKIDDINNSWENFANHSKIKPLEVFGYTNIFISILGFQMYFLGIVSYNMIKRVKE